MRFTFLISILIGCTAILKAQSVANFSLPNVQNNSSVSLSDFKGKKGVVVIFTSNVCPYSVYYEGRITQLIADYNDQIQFLLINSHTDDKESESEMKNKISAWGLSVPYLSDKEGKVQKSFGAKKSPEVFLLRPSNGSFVVFYKGAIDNNPQVATDVKEQYLKDNIDNLLAGKASTFAGTRPIGCMIK